MAMNTQKIAVGGIAAGAVIFILDFVANSLLLGERWRAAMEAVSPTLAANMESASAIVTYGIVDLVWGILLVWLYAAIRPNFGPGPRTAAVAAIFMWIATGMVWGVLAAMGMFGWGMYMLGAVAWLITLLVAGYVGGMVYKEAEQPAAPAM